MKFGLLFLLGATVTTLTQGFDYLIDEESEFKLFLTDVDSRIDDLQSLHVGDTIKVDVVGLVWVAAKNATDNTNITWTTLVDGAQVAAGSIDLSADGKLLPGEITTGEFAVNGPGLHIISVKVELDGVETIVEGEYEAYGAGVSIFPLIVILLLAATTQMVELSLFLGIFVGACIVGGSIRIGFFRTLDTYILGALADTEHGYVYLFTFFLSGLVGMMEKSGGFGGFTNSMAYWATTARAGQMVSFISGCAIFFDDYANTLIVGESMRPLTDLLSISREKLAFIVDGTSAPIASITPISAWIGFEIGLIQAELDKIFKSNDPDTIRISDNGLQVFLETVKYRYYPIFMLLLMPTLIWFKRDYGPMLIAERKTQVYARLDGGDGKENKTDVGEKANQPAPDTPERVWNMLVPLIILVILIIYLLIESGAEEGVDKTLIGKLQDSDSYSALLYGSMASALLTVIVYHCQFKQEGDEVLWPTPKVLKEWVKGRFKKEDDEIPTVRPLLSVYESLNGFLHGMGHVFPATIVLTLAWASASIMGAVGTDRLFAAWISDGVAPELLPTISFVISFFMALATGTSWGTMAIMFPLLLVPTYDASGGDPLIFYSTIAGILSGAVAGDHVSPISDTTVLTSLATDCNLLRHVVTQTPYVLWMCLFSILIGTLPVGYDGYPNGVSYLLGYVLILAFTFGICRPVINKNGNFDPLTELYLRFHKDSPLHELKHATAQAYTSMILKEAGEKSSYDMGGMVEEKYLDDDADEEIKEGDEADPEDPNIADKEPLDESEEEPNIAENVSLTGGESENDK